MDETATLAAIHSLRTNSAYQAAEARRRKIKSGGKSVATMATSADESAEIGAVLLLIGTWETIALILNGIKDKSKIFEITPVCYMWRELWPAIRIFRSSNPGYAEHFGELNKEYEGWLKKSSKGAEYSSAECESGLHAMFG